MDLIFSSFVLTFLLLVGALVEFLVTAFAPQNVSHSHAFSYQQKRAPVQLTPDLEPEYDQAA
jgi:hypothetical protein